MARELFAAGFVSCWGELDEAAQDALVRSLEAALASPSIPPETVTALLNLAEFMEHDEKALPLDTRCAPKQIAVTEASAVIEACACLPAAALGSTIAVSCIGMISFMMTGRPDECGRPDPA